MVSVHFALAAVAAGPLSGCAARKWNGCAAAGAFVGALAAGVAADSADRDNDGAIVAGAALGGMAIGAVLTHTICDPRIEASDPAPTTPEPPLPPPAEPPPPPLAKVVLTDEQLVTLEPIYFDHGEAVIRRVSYPVLDGIVTALNDHPGMKVRVEGHTDSRGGEAQNERLSARRAEAVVRYLVSRGIAAERLEAVGLGESRPIAPNQNPDGSANSLGRGKNRRTDFQIRQ